MSPRRPLRAVGLAAGLASVAALMLWRWSRRDVLGLGKGVLATP